MTKYKLRYFDVMGLAEPIRFLLSYSGQEFEDIRVAKDVWSKMKPTMPFGQLPTLEIDGKMYSQTIPICHYLAKQHGLLGKTDLDALEIDAIANALHDLRRQLAMYSMETDEVRKAKSKKEVVDTSVPFYLQKLEELASRNGGYLHGNGLTYADLFFVSLADAMDTIYESDVTQGKPSLTALRQKVREIPAIKKWLQKRPKRDI